MTKKKKLKEPFHLNYLLYPEFPWILRYSQHLRNFQIFYSWSFFHYWGPKVDHLINELLKKNKNILFVSFIMGFQISSGSVQMSLDCCQNMSRNFIEVGYLIKIRAEEDFGVLKVGNIQNSFNIAIFFDISFLIV